MAERVITLTIGNASIPLYAEDWPAVKKSVEEALMGRSNYSYCCQGKHERIQASRFTVADKSRLLGEA